LEPAWLESRSCRRCSSSDKGRAGSPAGLGLPDGALAVELVVVAAWPRGAVGKLAVDAGAGLLLGVVVEGAGELAAGACASFAAGGGAGEEFDVCIDTDAEVDGRAGTGAARSQLADCFFSRAEYLRRVR